MRSFSTFITFSILFSFGSQAFAAGEASQTFTLDGRLYADSAATTPLTDNDVKIVFQIVNPAQDCVLYEETVMHFDASVGNGYFTLHIGSAVGTAKRSSLDTAHPMSQVFSNTLVSISGRTFAGAACSYSPSNGDQRYLRVLVTPSSDNVTRTLTPNMALNSVPMAIVAERAESVQGLGPSNLLQTNSSGSQVLSQSNLESIFTSANYSALTSLLSGSSTVYSKPATNGTTPLANISAPVSPTAGQMWYDSGAIKFYNGSTTQTLGISGAGITSLSAGTGLNVGAGPGGTITSTGTLNVDVGTTAGKIVQLDVSAKLPAVDGSALTNLPAPTSVAGSAISGTIGGSTSLNTTGTISSGAITSSGAISGATGSFGSSSTGQLSLYDHATTNTNYVTIKTPATATLTADYTLTLPAALPGSSGQVLTSDTSGVLTWTSPSTGSVTSVTTGGAPIVIGGTASAPTVSVSAGSTSAKGVVQLGTSSDTAAGLVVQVNDTRLTDSRAPNGNATGDLSGTYPAPTVAKINGKAVTYTTLTSGDFLKYDGTGWVNAALSSANLSNNSDLLKASNMPANCSSGSTLTFSSPTGTWTCTSIPDATASSKGIMQVGTGLSVSSGSVTLQSGVITTPGTYAKVTVDTYGRVTNGANLGSSDITTALGYTPVNKAGDVMTGTLGLASYTNTAEATLVGAFVASDKGKTWFNSDIKQIRMWDGTQIVDVAAGPKPTSSEDGKSLRWNDTSKSWEYFTAGAAGSGIGTFNTLTANTQNLATGTSGTAPSWVSSGSTHTLNLPMASTSSVTAGLISKTDFDAFNSKLGTSSTFSGDVGGTSSTTSVDKIKGKSVVYTSIASGQLLKYDGTNWVNASLSSLDLSNDSNLLKASNMPASCSAGSTLTFSSPTGAWSCTAIPDATASSKGIMQVGTGLAVSSGTVSLQSGVITTPGTYAKVTVDTYGRVTSGATLGSSDITTALGYTPVNKSGDVMTGAFGLASYTNTTEATLIGGFVAADKGKTWFNSDIKQMRMWDGTQIVDIAAGVKPTSSEDGKSLRWNDTTKTWEYFTASASGSGIGTFNTLNANSQTLANGATGTAPAWVSSGSTHTLNIPMASATSVTAGLLSKTDYDTFNAKLGTASSFSGDVSGTSSTTSVDKIKGKALTYTSLSTGDFLKYDGTGWINSALSSANLSNNSDLLKASNMPANCSAGSTLTFSSPTGTWTCTTITGLAASVITSGTIADARLPASATYWQAATGGINYAGGNVGIGTTTPASALQVAGGVQVGSDAATCNATKAGTIRYNSNNVEYCNGTAWSVMNTGTSSAPAFYVHKNGTDQTVTASTYTKLTWSSKVFDTNNNFASDRFTPTVAGRYLITLTIYCPNASTYCHPVIYKNGGSTSGGTVGSGGGNVGNTATLILDMNGSTDYIEGFVYNTGTTVSGNAQWTSFSGALLNGSTVANSGSGSAGYIPVWSNSTALGNSPMAVSSGNVGIGTTAPETPLHVMGTKGIRLESTAAKYGFLSSKSTIHLSSNTDWDGTTWKNIETGKSAVAYVGPSGDLAFSVIADDTSRTAGTASSLTSVFNVKTNGNVGVGTSAPSEKLEVSGKVKATKFESNQTAIVRVYLNQCGGACGSYHTINSWMNVGVSYTHTTDNNDTTTFTTNGSGSVTVNKAGTYLIRITMMQIPTADSGAVYACPFVGGSVACYGGAGNQVKEFYTPAGWWRSTNHEFVATISAGSAVSYGYYPIQALNYWANDGWTGMEIIRLN